MLKKKALLLLRINNDRQLENKSKTFFLIKCNSFTNYTMVVTASKNIKIGIGRTNFELLTSYFLSIIFQAKLPLPHLRSIVVNNSLALIVKYLCVLSTLT